MGTVWYPPPFLLKAQPAATAPHYCPHASYCIQRGPSGGGKEVFTTGYQLHQHARLAATLRRWGSCTSAFHTSESYESKGCCTGSPFEVEWSYSATDEGIHGAQPSEGIHALRSGAPNRSGYGATCRSPLWQGHARQGSPHSRALERLIRSTDTCTTQSAGAQCADPLRVGACTPGDRRHSCPTPNATHRATWRMWRPSTSKV